MENKVSVLDDQELKHQISMLMQEFSNRFPFLIQLSPTEAKRISYVEAARFDFVRAAHSLATRNPKIQPQFFDIMELEKDLRLCETLDDVIPQFESILKRLIDTRSQAAHEAYGAALEIYATSKRGTTKSIEGAQVAYEELKKLFSGRGSKSEEKGDKQ